MINGDMLRILVSFCPVLSKIRILFRKKESFGLQCTIIGDFNCDLSELGSKPSMETGLIKGFFGDLFVLLIKNLFLLIYTHPPVHRTWIVSQLSLILLLTG